MGFSCLLSLSCLQFCLFFLNSSDTLLASASCYKSLSMSSLSLIPLSLLCICRRKEASMDPNTTADFFQGSSKFHTYYSQTKKGGGVIDLGLSLSTIQHETYLPPARGLDGYGELIDWSQQPSYRSITQLKSEDTGHKRLAHGYYNNEEESRGKYAYVKVNLDGLVVGRKVCLLDQGAYSTLALQLNDMFGMQTVSGLRLFQTESEFSLVYRDREGIWRNVGDVPWKEFLESVDRMRIARRNDALFPF
ncbi:auxin-responsive protein IAA32 isoform X2 [Arabidopsis lyrata subsp. lyrata]|uniref:auxin-responsive protein IAA32 isoform X2 n=1 Tax=Arabidopsis lyrata subsp. lyrata TaxID=81972 RepID=UPI000A29DD9B|nr:auxin-responsive protein IAA32 isoform X2 [Arabidopsis lyrata subsp. lyrata]|eukprot:XP_020880179.1 auxin-responsive protein IAA32 isoform X2 [Arabidopsis lyrata subsp. lyrata]